MGPGPGGPRKGAGRPKGSRNRRTIDMAFDALGKGESPISFVFRVMRNEIDYLDYALDKDGNVVKVTGDQPTRLRLEAAIRALRYLHPIPKPIDLDHPDGEQHKAYNKAVMMEMVGNAAKKLEGYAQDLKQDLDDGKNGHQDEEKY